MYMHVHTCRDDTGRFGKGQGYGVALRKVGQLQQKIEAWEVGVAVGVSSGCG